MSHQLNSRGESYIDEQLEPYEKFTTLCRKFHAELEAHWKASGVPDMPNIPRHPLDSLSDSMSELQSMLEGLISEVPKLADDRRVELQDSLIEQREYRMAGVDDV